MKFIIASFLVLFVSTSCLAAPKKFLQILHTNDLHSYWEHSLDPTRGGYSRIEALMDKLEADGDRRGWTTIRLDAGDFSDGNIDYLYGQGYYSFRLMKLMDYDAIAVGNHDYVTGLNPLELFAQNEDTRLPLVASNFDSDKMINVAPGRIIYRNGLKIAVAGGTTDSILYRWMAAPAVINPPEDTIDDWLSEQHDADIRIALTHIGLYSDIDLVKQSHSIDLVVGGHSHHTLHRPRYILNSDTHVVPVLQAGYHGRYLGQAVIQLPVWGTAQIVQYNLYPITSDLPQDPVVEGEVKTGLNDSALMGPGEDEIVALADDTLYTYRFQNSALGNFIADSLREAAGTDLALDIGALYGTGLPKGPITVRDIYNLQPHAFGVKDTGWKIYRMYITGKNLKKLIGIASLSEYSFLTSGLKAHLNWLHRDTLITVGGVPVDEDKIYSLAMSEGSVRAALSIPAFGKYLKPPFVNTQILIRDVLLNRAREIKVFHSQSSEEPRVVWPGSNKIIGSASCGECFGD